MSDRASELKLLNTSGDEINPATEDKQDDIIELVGGLSGSSSDGSTVFTDADVWYPVPTAPSGDYVLVVSKETEAGTIRWSFNSGGTPSSTNGNKMTSDDIIFHLAAGVTVRFGSSVAGDRVNWTTKII